MQQKKPRTMAAPPEVFRDRVSRLLFMAKYGCIPVAPGHWSLRQPDPAPGTELPSVANADPVQLRACANCARPLPDQRTKFCSDRCSEEAKRKTAREQYGHRHRFICEDCGCELHSGRHRK
jgi:hypothetical protein